MSGQPTKSSTSGIPKNKGHKAQKMELPLMRKSAGAFVCSENILKMGWFLCQKENSDKPQR